MPVAYAGYPAKRPAIAMPNLAILTAGVESLSKLDVPSDGFSEDCEPAATIGFPRKVLLTGTEIAATEWPVDSAVNGSRPDPGRR